MGAPKVIVKEIDKSDYVPSTGLFSDIYGAITFPAVRGPLNEAVLITSKAQFLRNFTPLDRIEINYDLGYYSALAFLSKGNKLWIKRAYSGTVLYAGAKHYSNLFTTTNAAFTVGQASKDSYSFGANEIFAVFNKDPGAWANSVIGYKLWLYRADETIASAAVNATTDVITTTQVYASGEPIRLILSSGGTMPAPLTETATYYTVAQSGGIKLAATQAEAIAGTPTIDITAVGTVGFKIVPMVRVKDPDTFLIQVFRSNATSTPIEEFNCSRVESKLDGYGQNMYVETAIQASSFIDIVDNTTILNTVMPKPQPTIMWLAQGSDGTTVTTSEMITSVSVFENTVKYPVTVLMDAGWAVSGYQVKLNELAIFRGDCVAILSTPYSAENDSNYINKLVDYKHREANISSSYAAMYTPHVKITDPWNDRDIYIAPDGYVGGAVAYTAQNYEVWYPVGGFRRGMLSVVDVKRRFSESPQGSGEMDYLYDNNINPIRFKEGGGIIIWGQKTTQDRPTALDRLNVRFLLIVIEKGGRDVLENFLFELNEESTRYRAQIVLESFMQSIKSRKGVYDFKVVCDESNNTPEDIDNNRLNVDLFIQPTKAIEYINFRVVITRTGADFSAVTV